MRKLLLTIPMAAALLAACADAEEKDTSARDELYRKSCSLIRAYTDSFEHTTDSATLAALSDRFEQKLAELNMKYPPATDMTMPDDYNDTLFMLTSRYVETRRRRLHPELYADSIATDSVAADSIKAAAAAAEKTAAGGRP